MWPRIREAVYVHVIHIVRHYPMTTVAGHATVFMVHQGSSVFRGSWNLDSALLCSLIFDGCLFYSEMKEALKHEEELWRHAPCTKTMTTPLLDNDQPPL